MNKAPLTQQIKTLLRNHYSAPLNNVFKQFRNGAIYFAVGLVIIYLATTALPPSVTQELATLAGMLLTGIGFMIAMLAQVRLIIGRLYQTLNKK